MALDSSCDDVGGCDVDSPQVRWLRADLAAADGRPTIVMWHHPRHSSGEHGNERDVDDLWEVSVGDPDVQVVLNGHDHDYERWHRMDAEGEPTTAGARQFVVGTGGRSHYCSDGERDSRSAVFDCSSFGVLALTLSLRRLRLALPRSDRELHGRRPQRTAPAAGIVLTSADGRTRTSP